MKRLALFLCILSVCAECLAFKPAAKWPIRPGGPADAMKPANVDWRAQHGQGQAIAAATEWKNDDWYERRVQATNFGCGIFCLLGFSFAICCGVADWKARRKRNAANKIAGAASVALLCLLSGCVTVPKNITINVRVRHERGYADGLPEGAHIVLPAARPSDDGAVIPQRQPTLIPVPEKK